MRSSRLLRLAAAVAVASSALVGFGTSPAAALTNYNVTTTADLVDPGDGALSLREAVTLANNDGDDSSISLSAGLTYDLTICQPKEPYDNGSGFFLAPDDDDANADGDLDHTEANTLTIVGNGSVIRQNCDYDRVLHSLSSDSLLVVDNATVRGGSDAPEYGDNIRALGSLALQNGTLVTDGNGFHGPGDFAVSVGDDDYEPGRTITITDSSVSANDESGVRASYGTFTVSNSTFDDNAGSAVVPDHLVLTMTGSSVQNNGGGGVSGVDATVTVIGSNVSNNRRGVGTTGNDPTVAPLTVADSTVADNAEGGVSCSFCASVTIDGATIANNGAIDGPLGSFGGVSILTYKASAGLSITDSTISGNRSPGDGGGVNARFSESAGEPAGYLPPIVISGSTIADNRSGIQDDGGGLYAESGHVEIADGSAVRGQLGQAERSPRGWRRRRRVPERRGDDHRGRGRVQREPGPRRRWGGVRLRPRSPDRVRLDVHGQRRPRQRRRHLGVQHHECVG